MKISVYAYSSIVFIVLFSHKSICTVVFKFDFL